MAKMCIPASVTILIMIVYNIADMYFIGQIGDPMQVAAISLTMPINSILSAIGTLIGGGACTAIAIYLGRKDFDIVKKMTSFCLYISIFIGLFFTFVIFIFNEPILNFIGTSYQTIEYTRIYMNTLFLGAPLLLLCSIFSNIIRATGSAKDSMLGNIYGTITNVVLDPILILVLNLGVKGAAVATIIGNLVALIYYIHYLKKYSSAYFSFNFSDFTLKPEVSLKIISLGLPTAIGVILMSFVGIFKNNALANYGDVIIAATGIIGRITMIIGLLQIGITTGIQPAIAYNFGAKNIQRVNQIIKSTAILTFIVGFTLTALGWIFGSELIRLFIDNIEVIEAGEQLIVGSLISGPIIGWFYICINYLQSTEKAKFATVLSTLRQCVLYIPILAIAYSYFGLMGIVYSNAISDIISTIISIVLCLIIYRKSVIKEISTE